MLTRLKVSGFKNLVDVDVRFGPFTCIAGANGIGKSNLFDAIQFLSSLSHRSLVEAALSVRDEGGRASDIRNLFHRVGNSYDEEMHFEAEMIVPQEGVDDLGQKADAGITFLRYIVTIGYRSDISRLLPSALELKREELHHINLGEAPKRLVFPHTPDWRHTAIKGRRTSPFISTEGEDASRVIKLHQDGSSGRPLPRSSANLPRTVLSVVNAAESPTALLAKREMQSWRLLQLEPSSLRRPDEFTAPIRIGTDGSHLASTLYHLAHSYKPVDEDQDQDDESMQDNRPEARVYAQVADRLSELIDDVRAVSVHRDERRELLTLQVKGKDGTRHPAQALSDGTLRFLALSVLALDPEAEGLLCLEEPENGIHPERIPAMLRLLQAIVTDVRAEVGPENPLRQVIINTHSPSVVLQVPEDSLLVAESKDTVHNGKRFNRVCFSGLPNTWRTNGNEKEAVPMGQLLSYLNPVILSSPNDINGILDANNHERKMLKYMRTPKRVFERPDVRQLLLIDIDSDMD